MIKGYARGGVALDHVRDRKPRVWPVTMCGAGASGVALERLPAGDSAAARADEGGRIELDREHVWSAVPGHQGKR